MKIKKVVLAALFFLVAFGLAHGQCPIPNDSVEVGMSLAGPFGGWDVKAVRFIDRENCVLEFCDGSSEFAHYENDSWILQEGKTFYMRSELGGKLEVLAQTNSGKWSIDFVLYDGKNTITYRSIDKNAWKYVRIEALLRFIQFRKGKDFVSFSGMPAHYHVVAGYGHKWDYRAIEVLQSIPSIRGENLATQAWYGFNEELTESPYGLSFAD